MNVIVTGGAGFIGSNLVEHMVRDGHKVYVFDNFMTGLENNLQHLVPKQDIFRSYDCLSHINKPDILFHLGTPSSSPMYKDNPYLVSEALHDWITILLYTREQSCKLVYASSSSVYNGNVPPFKEDMPIYVTDYYTECRYGMERLAELFHRLYDVSSIGLRLFSVYGRNETHKGRYANCLTQFLWAIAQGKPVIIFGDGSQTRDLTYVDDVVEAFTLAATKEIDYGIFNVGTGKAYSFNAIVDLLNAALGTAIQPTYIDNPIKNYVQQTQADTQLAEQILGFKAKTPLPEGIEKIKDFYTTS